MDTVLQITLQMSSYYMSGCGNAKCFHARVCSLSTAGISGTDNPDTICKCQYVVHFINICAGIIMGPYMLTNRLTAQQYCNFLKTVLLWLLEDTTTNCMAEVVVSVQQRSSTQISVAVAAHSLITYVYAFRPYTLCIV